MADIFRTVEIIFSAVDQTGDALKNISRNTDSFSASISSLTKPLSDFGDLALKAETAIAGIGVAFGAVALNSFKDFQSATVELQKVMSDTDGSITQFTDKSKELALQYGISADEILKGTAAFVQAGFSAQESAKLQENAIQLMIAGDLDAAAATQTLISSIKGFNATAADAPRFIEALNNVSNKFATDVTQLAEGMSRVSPIAQQMGFSFEETTGLLTPIIEVFGNGALAADGLKTGLLKLVDDSKPVRDALASIGVSQFDLNGHLRSGKDIFYDVANAFQTLDQNQKLFITSQLVGIDQAPKMVKVFDDLAKVQAVTAVAMQNTGSVATEVEKRLNTLEGEASRNAQSWNILSVAIGEKLATGAVSSTNGLNSLAQALTNAVNSGSFDPILNEINAINLGFAEFVESVARNLPAALENVDFSGLVKSFENIGFSVGDIFSGLDLTTADGLASAIQFVVDSFASLNNVVAGIIDAWDPFINAFLKGVDVFNNSGESVQQYVGLALGLSQVFESMRGLVGDVSGAFSTLSGIFSGIGNTGIVTTIGGIVAALAAPEILGAGAAFAALGTGIAGLLGLFDDTTVAQNAVVESSTRLKGSQEEILKQLAEISSRTGVSVKSLYDLRTAVDDGRLVFDEASNSYVKAGTGIKDYDAEVKAASVSQFDFAKTVNGVADAFNLNAKAANETVSVYATHEQAINALMAADSKLVDQYIIENNGLFELHQTQKQAADSADALGKTKQELAIKTDELSERQKIAIENTHELEMQLLELASNERIKSMEFTANIKIADIQAQAEQVVAAFESIGTAIEATQKAQAEIFDSLVEGLASDSIRGLDKQFLQEFAKRQQEQAQQALDNQTMLVEAQVASLNARTEALRNGTALININADNLAPELQAVMRSLLEHIQIEANAEGLELLL